MPVSEASWLRRLFTGRTKQIVNKVRDLANAELAASGLPGGQGGPGDAYRHMLAAGELARRVGPLEAYSISEWNEWRGEAAGETQRERGVRIPPANQPGFIGMDRHNNTMGIGIGARAWTFDDVVEGAREALSRAGSDGSGFAGRLGFEKSGTATRPRTNRNGRIPTGPPCPVAIGANSTAPEALCAATAGRT